MVGDATRVRAMMGDVCRGCKPHAGDGAQRTGWSLYRWVGVCAMLTLAALLLLSLVF